MIPVNFCNDKKTFCSKNQNRPATGLLYLSLTFEIYLYVSTAVYHWPILVVLTKICLLFTVRPKFFVVRVAHLLYVPDGQERDNDPWPGARSQHIHAYSLRYLVRRSSILHDWASLSFLFNLQEAIGQTVRFSMHMIYDDIARHRRRDDRIVDVRLIN